MGKRFCILVMTIIMALSCTVFASAACPETGTVEFSEVLASADSTTVSTRDMQALTDMITHSNLSSGQTVTGKFIRNIPSQTNITVVISCSVPCTVTVKSGLPFGSSMSRYIPAGTGTYTICSGKGNLSYEIRVHADAAALGYQFFTTDGKF